MKQTAILFLVALFAMAGCKPTIPSEYIQPGDMEDILYDYQIAQAMGAQVGDGGRTPSDVDKNVYKMTVLKKYGITQQQFDTSLEYYLRHTEELHKIYENLAERMQKEAVSLGASVSDYNQFGTAQQGDTTNIWNKAQAFLLSPDDYLNQETFCVKADTAFHKGDKIMLNFDAQFIVQDGTRDAIAVLVVKFDNDSIVTQNTRITGNNHYTLTMSNTGKMGIKEVKGFFLFNRGETDSQTTLKLLCIYNTQLIRLHLPSASQSPSAGKDSLQNAAAPSSSSATSASAGSAPPPSQNSPQNPTNPSGPNQRTIEDIQLRPVDKLE